MKAVFFGGSGYVGRQLSRATTAFDDILLVDRRGVASDGTETADVRQPIPVGLAGATPPDWIVLLAAVHREPGHEPSEYFETNIWGARNVAAYADAVGCSNIFFFSSTSVYGAASTPTDERSTPCPNSAYGSSKLAAELILEGWQRAAPNRRLVICRPGVVYGPGDPGNMLRMVRGIRRGMFAVPGNRRLRKSYAYVSGLIESFDFVVGRSEPLIVYNYVERETETLDDLITAIRDEFQIRRPVPTLPPVFVLGAAHAAQLATAGHSAIHPTRVRKAAQPTHVVPRWLVQNGFEFRFDFRSSLEHWRAVAPEDFE
jgi:nucleoside-diphosphate-sugar epimerase